MRTSLVKTLRLFLGGFLLWQGLGASALAFTGIVISEFKVQGTGGGNDEFVEIMNTTGLSVNIGGWKFMASSSSGNTSARAIFPSVILGPGEHFLLANTAYSESVPPNQIYTTGVTTTGGLAIVNTNGTVMDAVGSGSTIASYREGIGLNIPATGNYSFARKNGGTQDTDDNASDFNLSSTPQPENHPIVLRFDSANLDTNGVVQLQCSGAPLKTYRLLEATNAVGAYLPIATNSSAGDGTFKFEETPVTGAARFYRLAP